MLAYIKKNRVFYFVVILFWSFMLLRQWDRFIHPTLWAEDGRVFFLRSALYGWTSLFISYAGYYQFIPQLISVISYKISLLYYPLTTLILSTLVYAIVLSSLVDSAFAWVHGNRLIRVFLIITLSLIPGTSEIVGNLANLHSVLLLVTFFYLLKEQNNQYQIPRMIILLFISLSAGESIILIPCLFYNSIKYWHKQQYKIVINNVSYILILLAVAALNYLSFKSTPDGHNISISTIATLCNYLPKFYLTLLNRLFYIPFLGPYATILINTSVGFALSFGSFLILFYLFIILKVMKVNRDKMVLLLILIGSYSLEILLTVVARPEASITPFFGKFDNITQFGVRYSFFILPIVLISWVFIFQHLIINTKIKTIIVIGFLICFCGNFYQGFLLKNFYQTYSISQVNNKFDFWSFNVEPLIRSIRENKTTVIRMVNAPDGWFFDLKLNNGKIREY